MTRALRTLALTTALAASSVSATALAADHHSEAMFGATEAHATLIDQARNEIGQARLQQGPEGVLITIELDGAPDSAAGWHGVHLHQIGDCSNADFTSSGGHINPSGRSHGLLNAEGPDNADLPNIYVHEDGVLRAQIFTDRVSLNGEYDAPALLDGNGSALVIHDNEDDHTTQPIGGAGARHVCGVIEAAH
ncbi:superoxide dismutase family protein [Oceanicaulis alexandrii]|uniref:superoxide dismutase family protein n=1 Tax=Oceanicaulis alexandrii TaxID=153233 RepID=UPI0035D0DE31